MISPWTIIGWTLVALLGLNILSAIIKAFMKTRKPKIVCPKCKGRVDCLDAEKNLYYCYKCNEEILMTPITLKGMKKVLKKEIKK